MLFWDYLTFDTLAIFTIYNLRGSIYSDHKLIQLPTAGFIFFTIANYSCLKVMVLCLRLFFLRTLLSFLHFNIWWNSLCRSSTILAPFLIRFSYRLHPSICSYQFLSISLNKSDDLPQTAATQFASYPMHCTGTRNKYLRSEWSQNKYRSVVSIQNKSH